MSDSPMFLGKGFLKLARLISLLAEHKKPIEIGPMDSICLGIGLARIFIPLHIFSQA